MPTDRPEDQTTAEYHRVVMYQITSECYKVDTYQTTAKYRGTSEIILVLHISEKIC